MKIKISAQIAPTENSEKILQAIQKKFPNAVFKTLKSQIFCETTNKEVLSEIKRIVEEKRIANTVRYLVLEHHKIEINKQALMVGRINFVEETYPLGNVIIEAENEKELLDYLAPSTI